MRSERVSVMITSNEKRLLQEFIASRVMDGESLTMSTLIRALVFHPENRFLENLLSEVDL